MEFFMDKGTLLLCSVETLLLIALILIINNNLQKRLSNAEIDACAGWHRWQRLEITLEQLHEKIAREVETSKNEVNMTPAEKQNVKACLLNFVERVSKGDCSSQIGKIGRGSGEKVLGEESQALPEVVKLLINHFDGKEDQDQK